MSWLVFFVKDPKISVQKVQYEMWMEGQMTFIQI